MPEDTRPKLIMTYWDGTDSVGHIHGTKHKKIYDQMIRQDQMLGLLFSRLEEINAWDYVTLLLVSDHGMIDVNQYISLKSILDTLEIDYILSAGPAVAHVFIDDKDHRSQASLRKLQIQLHTCRLIMSFLPRWIEMIFLMEDPIILLDVYLHQRGYLQMLL